MLTPLYRLAVWMLIAGSAVMAQDTPSAEVRPAQVLLELRELRSELLHELLERQTERIEQLESEVEHARVQRMRLEETLRAQQEDLGTWSQELQGSEYAPQERAQLEAARISADTESAQRVSREKKAAEERESALSVRLGRAKERQRRLSEALAATQTPR